MSEEAPPKPRETQKARVECVKYTRSLSSRNAQPDVFVHQPVASAHIMCGLTRAGIADLCPRWSVQEKIRKGAFFLIFALGK